MASGNEATEERLGFREGLKQLHKDRIHLHRNHFKPTRLGTISSPPLKVLQEFSIIHMLVPSASPTGPDTARVL
jgi:hypothetical protein